MKFKYSCSSSKNNKRTGNLATQQQTINTQNVHVTNGHRLNQTRPALSVLHCRTQMVAIQGGFAKMSRKWPKTAEKMLKRIKLAFLDQK